MSFVSEVKASVKAVDDYWFGHGSPTTLGLFRAVLGSLAFINLAMIAVDWDSWFSERGFVPAWLGNKFAGGGTVPIWGDRLQFAGHTVTIPQLDLLNGITDSRITIPFYALTTVFALLTALGLWTRGSTIALAIGLVSMHHRNELILHGGDTVLRLGVLYMALAPCGRACSLDRMIRLWKGRDSGAPLKVSLWPQRLVTYNVALIYFTTVWLKWYGHLWKNGTATWYPARLAEFYRFPVPKFLNELPMVYITTYGTLATEFCMATLVFYRPTRKWCLLAGIGLHMSIEYSMNIPLFSYLMIGMYLCFYEGEEISSWAERLGQRMTRYHTIVRLPAGMRLSARGVAFFDAADPFKIVTYLPGDSNVLASSEVRKSWTHSFGSWLYAWIPGLWRSLLSRSIEPVPDEPERDAPLPAPHRPKKSKAKR